MALQITGIRKPNPSDPHEAISHYRWLDHDDNTTGIDEREALIAWMEENKVKAFVANGSDKVWCGIRKNQHGTKYLQTYADDQWNNNLLSLDQC